ncbi:MAG TPA: VWA domain-containing protein [Mycobacteriales bacterium]|nr:VWA domain-containing protein [Mycobacteriales bacterium]
MTTTRDVTDVVLGFARTLRHAGVDASPERVQAMLVAVGFLDVRSATHVYWSGRSTLCGSPDDLAAYDAAFAAYFGGELPRTARRAPHARDRLSAAAPFAVEAPGEGSGEEGPDVRTAASGAEVLRHRDVATLSPGERDELRRLFLLLRPDAPTRRSRRLRPARRGRVDVPRTVRQTLRRGGETGRLARQRPRAKPRRVVLLLDVSGSMSPYADTLLRFAHVAARRHPASTEVFTMGTRLTRVTRPMRQRDPDRALAASGQAIPDWSGGTRLGEVLKAFLDRWGQRGTARRAVVVLFSDGWERGDPALLGEQMARLARLAHLVVWVNPHKGKDGYAPLTGGMQAALPYVDEFVAGHSLAALEHLVEVMRRA